MTEQYMGWLIYFLGRVDLVRDVGAIFSVISFVALIISCIIKLIPYEEYEKKDREMATKVFNFPKIVFFICFPVVLLLPPSKEIVAIWLVPKIVNNEKIQALPEKTLDILSLKLDEWIGDLKKEER